jgi:hypothetical protein
MLHGTINTNETVPVEELNGGRGKKGPENPEDMAILASRQYYSATELVIIIFLLNEEFSGATQGSNWSFKSVVLKVFNRPIVVY